MAELKKLSESVIFRKGQKVQNDYFIGTAEWLEPVTDDEYNHLL